MNLFVDLILVNRYVSYIYIDRERELAHGCKRMIEEGREKNRIEDGVNVITCTLQ
jgi:hypothetical protein